MRFPFGWCLVASMLGLVAVDCASVTVVDDDSDGETTDRDDPPPAPADPPPHWSSVCPTPSELGDVGADALGECPNEPLDGELSSQNAEDLLYRVVHEAGHIASLVAGGEGGLFARRGSDFSAQTDDGYVVGKISDGDPATCAVVEFGCWTGGHGGWGPSALAGQAFIEITLEDGAVRRVRIESEALWLVEAAPLVGTPRAEVAVEMTIVDGEIAELGATIGKYVISR